MLEILLELKIRLKVKDVCSSSLADLRATGRHLP